MLYRNMHFLQPDGPPIHICYVLEITAHHGPVGPGNWSCKGKLAMSPRTLDSTFIRSLTDAATFGPFLNALLALKQARVAEEGVPSRVAAPEPRPVPVAA